MKTAILPKTRNGNGAVEEVAISLPRMDIQHLKIVLVGDSPLISHAWSQKTKAGMLKKQMKQAKAGKEAKVPEQDFKDSIYRNEKGEPSFPAVAFKNAAVDACSHVEGVTKVQARGAFHIIGDMVKIKGTPTMRQDMVRIGMGTADIRYRAEYKTWSVEITLRYNNNVLSDEQIINLLNTAGFAIGVGEWRPQRDGSFGMFHVSTSNEN